MKILFVRHGESVDDLTDQYGGWADFHLTPEGSKQMHESADKIVGLNIDFDLVLTSPLWRAEESARIIANKLSLPLETYHFLKEKNGYGLLSGMNKAEAKLKYPALVEDLEAGYVFGAEPVEQFKKRVLVAAQNIAQMNKNIIAVTHGGFLTTLFEVVLGKKLLSRTDGSFVLLEAENGKFLIEKVEGIEYE